MKKKLASSIVIPLCFISLLEANEVDNIKNLSKKLVDVRQEIEALHTKISYKKESYNDRIRSYSNQKSDLDIKISRNELRIKELQRDLEKIKVDNLKNSSVQKNIVPILKNSITTLRETIKSSIPFKLQDRLNALADIEHRIDANLVTPNKAANQLWAFVEDEMMLGKSSGIYSDKIEIDGEIKLVKVLKVGKIALFFKSDQERYGMITKDGNLWKQTMITTQEQVQNTAKLFDTFAKQIRTGKFTINNILPNS